MFIQALHIIFINVWRLFNQISDTTKNKGQKLFDEIRDEIKFNKKRNFTQQER